MRSVINILLVSLIFFGCKKAEDRSCLKSVGDVDTLSVSIDAVDSIFLNVGLKYELYDSDTPHIEIIGGQNLISFVDVTPNGNNLSFVNTNKCKFLRSFKDEILVKIYQPELRFIFAEISDTLKAPNPLNYENLFVFSHTGAGHINLNLNTENIFLDISSGNLDFNFHGNTKQLGLSIKSSGYGSARDLMVENYVDVFSKSVADFGLNVEGVNGKVLLDGKGDISLYGIDNGIEVTNTGEGEIIYVN